MELGGWRNERGFTLIEVLLGAGLLVLFYGIVFSGFSDFMELDRTGRHLSSDLRWAQRQAIFSNRNCYIQLDMEKNEYQIFREKQGDVEQLRSRELEGEIFFKEISLSEPVFHFTPSGAPSRGNSIVISNGVSQLRVITAVATGRVRIEKD